VRNPEPLTLRRKQVYKLAWCDYATLGKPVITVLMSISTVDESAFKYFQPGDNVRGASSGVEYR